MINGPVNRPSIFSIIPVETGIQYVSVVALGLDARLRWHDRLVRFL